MQASHWMWLGLHCAESIDIPPHHCPELTLQETEGSRACCKCLSTSLVSTTPVLWPLTWVLRALPPPCCSGGCSLGGSSSCSPNLPQSLLNPMPCSRTTIAFAQKLPNNCWGIRDKGLLIYVQLYRDTQGDKGIDTMRGRINVEIPQLSPLLNPRYLAPKSDARWS